MVALWVMKNGAGLRVAPRVPSAASVVMPAGLSRTRGSARFSGTPRTDKGSALHSRPTWGPKYIYF